MQRSKLLLWLALASFSTTACVVTYHRIDDTGSLPKARVRPGITVLLTDSISLIQNKRVGLLTNRAGVDERGRSDITLLRTDKRAIEANVHLVALFAPEHGLSGTEDRTNLPSTIDPATKLPVYSLYGAETVAPPDSALQSLDVIVIDLPDVGSRTWTYEGVMVYTLRAAARLKKPVVILDRPNPLTGAIVEGPLLDSALANPEDPAPGRPGKAYAMYSIPLRHGMTMGELARFYNAELKINADLKVVVASGWQREVWLDMTNLPFVRPSPNLPTFQSVMLYPGLVAFESTNLSVGRGTDAPFQRIGAPWLNAEQVIRVLRDQKVLGVKFEAEHFTPHGAGDGKYEGQHIAGIKITTVDRSALQTSRLTAALLSAVYKVHPKELEIKSTEFDLRFGSSAAREALLAGKNPDAVVDQSYGPAYAFRERVKRYLLY